ncbi:zinc transporter ZIP8-like [Pecten maximus]|uniref:zinc transporter ZIP8-like n=1 Tax=Pecten maximus TaxID=6579 RepID=UPI001457EC45|nr:zinc transporter ZIP8-like [Pecten maximus]
MVQNLCGKNYSSTSRGNLTASQMYLVIFLVVGFLTGGSFEKVFENINVKELFVNRLLDKYGSEGAISEEGFYKLGSILGLDPTYGVCNSTTDTCLRQCLGYADIFKQFSTNSSLNSSGLTNCLPAIVYSAQDPYCHHGDEKEIVTKPSSAEAWSYGIGSASIIVFISNIGLLFKPCMQSRGFQRIMYFCVALAVGTLGGTGILVLIPESLGMTGDDNPIPDYKWKLTMSIVGVYVFFVLERSINIASNRRGKNDVEKAVETTEQVFFQNADSHGHSHVRVEGGVATVAWTLLLGDALHNFSDGLAMGAAYTESVAVGISVSLAILSEELPHELGDIAILLHSGMTIKRALLLNFLAAVTIYFGLVIGIVVGENTDANTYVFAFSGGLFIYIALADMIPEMNKQATFAAKAGHDGAMTVFFHQNIGLLLGFTIVILLAAYGSIIS